MRRLTLAVWIAVAVLVAGCTTHTAGVSGVARPTAESPALDAAADPCSLLDERQREQLGVGPGDVLDTSIEGSAFCGWRSEAGNGDSFEAGVYPSRLRLDDVVATYPSPERMSVLGLDAVSTSARASVAERSCMIFAELPSGNLALASYFWEGLPEQGTREESCRLAKTALEMVIATVVAR